MKKAIILFILFIFIMLANPSMALVGFGPTEIFCSNNEKMILGTASLINGDDIPKYGLFTLFNPYVDKDTWVVVPTEIIHARVLCLDCGHEMQRYEVIPGYTYGDPLVGTCITTGDEIGCGSSNLRFYDPIPRDEFRYVWLETAGNFDLKETSDPYTWITTNKIPPGGTCNVQVMYDPSDSYILDNFDKNWEFHLRGRTVENENDGNFMAGGVDLRILMTFKFPLHITLLDQPEKGEKFDIKITWGPPDNKWSKTPESIYVTFNGITTKTNQKGVVSFIFPDTRGDYEYILTAKGTDTYLSATKIITDKIQNKEENGSLWDFFGNIYVIIAIFIVVIICIAIAVRHYFTYG